jgi:5-(carboxyamino)imidazole ribonucleotide mutase
MDGKIEDGKSRAMVGILMGSRSDWSHTMRFAAETLESLNIPFETRVISAHRTPDRMARYCHEAKSRGLKVLIAGAGGAAALPGAVAALTPLPVLGVPVKGVALGGLDSLLSMVQMPGGIPVATLALGKAGAINAALFSAAILALSDREVAAALDRWRERQTEAVPETPED